MRSGIGLYNDFLDLYHACQKQPGIYENFEYQRIRAKFDSLVAIGWCSLELENGFVFGYHGTYVYLGDKCNGAELSKCIEMDKDGNIRAYEQCLLLPREEENGEIDNE